MEALGTVMAKHFAEFSSTSFDIWYLYCTEILVIPPIHINQYFERRCGEKEIFYKNGGYYKLYTNKQARAIHNR